MSCAAVVSGALKTARPSHHTFTNPFLRAALRSPSHPLLSADLLLLTFTGRKTGRSFTIPVTYVQNGQRLVIFTPNPWWRNLRGSAPVTVNLRGQPYHAVAEPSQDRAVVLREMRGYLARKGIKRAGRIGLRLDPSRDPSDAELETAARGHVVVSITLPDPKG